MLIGMITMNVYLIYFIQLNILLYKYYATPNSDSALKKYSFL